MGNKGSAESAGLFRKILVPFDGSEYSQRALQVAEKLTKENDAYLIIVNAVSTPTYAYMASPGVTPIDVGRLDSAAREEANKMVAGALSEVEKLGLKGRGEVLQSGTSIVSAITEFASKEHVDLIVIGTRGIGGFKKLLLGSVSNGVVSHAHCSVLVVR